MMYGIASVTSKALAQDKSKLLTRILIPCQNCRTCLQKPRLCKVNFPKSNISIFTIAVTIRSASWTLPGRFVHLLAAQGRRLELRRCRRTMQMSLPRGGRRSGAAMASTTWREWWSSRANGGIVWDEQVGYRPSWENPRTTWVSKSS